MPTYRLEHSCSSKNMALVRRRDPLPTDPARSKLPDLIRRPAFAPGATAASSSDKIAEAVEALVDDFTEGKLILIGDE